MSPGAASADTNLTRSSRSKNVSPPTPRPPMTPASSAINGPSRITSGGQDPGIGPCVVRLRLQISDTPPGGGIRLGSTSPPPAFGGGAVSAGLGSGGGQGAFEIPSAAPPLASAPSSSSRGSTGCPLASLRTGCASRLGVGFPALSPAPFLTGFSLGTRESPRSLAGSRLSRSAPTDQDRARVQDFHVECNPCPQSGILLGASRYRAPWIPGDHDPPPAPARCLCPARRRGATHLQNPLPDRCPLAEFRRSSTISVELQAWVPPSNSTG